MNFAEYVLIIAILLLPVAALVLMIIREEREVRARLAHIDSLWGHSERLERIAALEHALGLHDEAMREVRYAWADDVKSLAVWHDGTADLPLTELPPKPPCPECVRVKNADLCLCRQCTPLWTRTA